MRKRGRPKASHRLADGTELVGLSRQSDDRWRISETGETFFAEEYEAIARFQAVVAKRRGRNRVDLPLGPHTDTFAALEATREAGAAKLNITVGPNNEPIEYSVSIGSDAFYAAVQRMLIEQPKLLAMKTGVEWVGYGDQLSKPVPSPTMAELVEVYAAKQGLTPEEVTRCRMFWTEFTTIVGIKTIRELTYEHVETYEARIADKDLSPKSIKHRYTRIRTILSYAIKRGKGTDDCRHALDVLAMLEVSGANPLKPDPITPAKFWSIHSAALKAGDDLFATLMLFSLNAALYSSEVGAVRWKEIDAKRGEFTTFRNKTNVPRVAVLWPETLKALKLLPMDRETVFNTKIQAYNRFSVHRDWTKYRLAAKVKDATFAQIRDAAFTIACRVSMDQARALAGHRFPGAVDNYVLRNAQFVAAACEAIRREFAVAKYLARKR